MGHHLGDALGGDVREQRRLPEVVDQPLERPPGRLGRAVELADLGPVARDDMAHGRRLLAAPGGPARLLDDQPRPRLLLQPPLDGLGGAPFSLARREAKSLTLDPEVAPVERGVGTLVEGHS